MQSRPLRREHIDLVSNLARHSPDGLENRRVLMAPARRPCRFFEKIGRVVEPGDDDGKGDCFLLRAYAVK